MQAARGEIRHPRVGMGVENIQELEPRYLAGWESILYA